MLRIFDFLYQKDKATEIMDNKINTLLDEVRTEGWKVSTLDAPSFYTRVLVFVKDNKRVWIKTEKEFLTAYDFCTKVTVGDMTAISGSKEIREKVEELYADYLTLV